MLSCLEFFHNVLNNLLRHFAPSQVLPGGRGVMGWTKHERKEAWITWSTQSLSNVAVDKCWTRGVCGCVAQPNGKDLGIILEGLSANLQIPGKEENFKGGKGIHVELDFFFSSCYIEVLWRNHVLPFYSMRGTSQKHVSEDWNDFTSHLSGSLLPQCT